LKDSGFEFSWDSITQHAPIYWLIWKEFFLEDESEVVAGMDITMGLVQAIAEWN